MATGEALMLVRPHGGMNRRVLAVLADEDVGGAVDVEGGRHLGVSALCLGALVPPDRSGLLEHLEALGTHGRGL